MIKFKSFKGYFHTFSTEALKDIQEAKQFINSLRPLWYSDYSNSRYFFPSRYHPDVVVQLYTEKNARPVFLH